MEDNGVTLKATVNGLILIMKEEYDFDSILEQIERKLTSAGKFFKGASLVIKYRGRKLSGEQENAITGLMTRKTGAEIRSFEEDTEEISKIAEAEAVKANNKTTMKKLFFDGIKEGRTKFYRGTVRSGQLISYDGNLVIIGDVNPGGEIEATGNIMVMGWLRGIVHAGSDGNKEALVVAINLQPTQLRIADVITRSPDEMEQRNVLIPELAFVKDDRVYIESFLPQR